MWSLVFSLLFLTCSFIFPSYLLTFFLSYIRQGEQGNCPLLCSFSNVNLSLSPSFSLYEWLLLRITEGIRPPQSVWPVTLTFTKGNSEEFNLGQVEKLQINFATMSTFASIHMTPRHRGILGKTSCVKWAFDLSVTQKHSLFTLTLPPLCVWTFHILHTMSTSVTACEKIL